jgi:hypothetical protein
VCCRICEIKNYATRREFVVTTVIKSRRIGCVWACSTSGKYEKFVQNISENCTLKGADTAGSWDGLSVPGSYNKKEIS